MEHVVPMHQAKSSLSQLVRRAAAGETILIGPDGKAAAKLVPVHAGSGRPMRRLGGLKGRLVVPDDFDAPLPDDLLDQFEGRAR